MIEDEWSFAEIFAAAWNGKWLIVSITGIAAVASVLFALSLPNVYRAEALLAPNEGSGASALSSLAAQYGGLASLAGINLSSGNNDKTAVGLAILQSQQFISDFVVRRELLVPLMAASGWNEDTGELEIDDSVFDSSTNSWVRKPNKHGNIVPSGQEAFRQFREILSVNQDRRSGMVRIGVEHYSPAIAAQWVTWLVEDANRALMSQDVREAEQAIKYLREQVEITSLATLQSVFFKLIEEQTKTVLLAKVSDEYFLKTIDPAIAPEERARPNRAAIAIVGTFFGGVLSLVVVFATHASRRS